MKGKILIASLAIVAALVLTGGVLRAQRARSVQRTVVVNEGDSSTAWLGVRLEDVNADKVRELKLEGEFGAVVREVTPDSPAAKAGIQVNDVILDFEGQKVWSIAEIRRMIRETPVGRSVTLELSRDGKRQSVRVTLGERPEGEELSGTIGVQPGPPTVIRPEIHLPPYFDFEFGFWGRPRLGIRPEELTPQLAEYFGVKEGKGVLVAEVESGSPAAKAGLKAGDCIVKIDSTLVGSVQELQRALQETNRPSTDAKRQVTLTIVRDKSEQTVQVELETHRNRLLMQPTQADTIEVEPGDIEALEGDIAAMTPELEQQAAEYRRQAEEQSRQAARQMENLRQELQKQQGAWKHQMDEMRKQLQEELRRAQIEWDTV